MKKIIIITDQYSKIFGYRILNSQLSFYIGILQLFICLWALTQHIFSLFKFNKILYCDFSSNSTLPAMFTAVDIIIFDIGLFHSLWGIHGCVAQHLDGGYGRFSWCITHVASLIFCLPFAFVSRPKPYYLWPLLIQQSTYGIGLLILSLAALPRALPTLMGELSNVPLHALLFYLFGTFINFFLLYIYWHWYWYVEAIWDLPRKVCNDQHQQNHNSVNKLKNNSVSTETVLFSPIQNVNNALNSSSTIKYWQNKKNDDNNLIKNFNEEKHNQYGNKFNDTKNNSIKCMENLRTQLMSNSKYCERKMLSEINFDKSKPISVQLIEKKKKDLNNTSNKLIKSNNYNQTNNSILFTDSNYHQKTKIIDINNSMCFKKYINNVPSNENENSKNLINYKNQFIDNNKLQNLVDSTQMNTSLSLLHFNPNFCSEQNVMSRKQSKLSGSIDYLYNAKNKLSEVSQSKIKNNDLSAFCRSKKPANSISTEPNQQNNMQSTLQLTPLLNNNNTINISNSYFQLQPQIRTLKMNDLQFKNIKNNSNQLHFLSNNSTSLMKKSFSGDLIYGIDQSVCNNNSNNNSFYKNSLIFNNRPTSSISNTINSGNYYSNQIMQQQQQQCYLKSKNKQKKIRQNYIDNQNKRQKLNLQTEYNDDSSKYQSCKYYPNLPTIKTIHKTKPKDFYIDSSHSQHSTTLSQSMPLYKNNKTNNLYFLENKYTSSMHSLKSLLAFKSSLLDSCYSPINQQKVKIKKKNSFPAIKSCTQKNNVVLPFTLRETYIGHQENLQQQEQQYINLKQNLLKSSINQIEYKKHLFQNHYIYPQSFESKYHAEGNKNNEVEKKVLKLNKNLAKNLKENCLLNNKQQYKKYQLQAKHLFEINNPQRQQSAFLTTTSSDFSNEKNYIKGLLFKTCNTDTQIPIVYYNNMPLSQITNRKNNLNNQKISKNSLA